MSVAHAKAQLLMEAAPHSAGDRILEHPLASAAAAFAAGFVLARGLKGADTRPRRHIQWSAVLRPLIAGLGPIGARYIVRWVGGIEEQRAARVRSTGANDERRDPVWQL